MREDRCIISPALAKKKKKRYIQSQTNNVAHTHFFSLKQTVLESGLLYMVVQVIYCTTLRYNINIM